MVSPNALGLFPVVVEIQIFVKSPIFIRAALKMKILISHDIYQSLIGLFQHILQMSEMGIVPEGFAKSINQNGAMGFMSNRHISRNG